MLEPLRDLWGFLTFTVLGVWMLLLKNRWIALLKKTGLVNLRYEYFNRMGTFFVEKPT